MNWRAGILLLLALLCGPAAARPERITLADLPPEARTVLRAIQSGARFSHPKDGSVFHNFEGKLPPRPRGYYREYTVPTPGAKTRGARRLIAGGQPPEVFYYTDDHYQTFRRIEE